MYYQWNIYYYNTLRKNNEISYDKIKYISKELRYDRTTLFNLEKTIYRVKIKNAGSFIYYYTDESLVFAIKELAKRCNLDILDKTSED